MDEVKIPDLGAVRFSPKSDFFLARKIQFIYKDGDAREPICEGEDEFPICPACYRSHFNDRHYLTFWVEAEDENFPRPPIPKRAVLSCSCSYGYDIFSEKEVDKLIIHMV